MNSSGMGGGFLSGYNGGFLGMNKLQQPQSNSNNAVHGHQINHNNVQSSMSAKLGLVHDKPIGIIDVKGCRAFGKDKAVGPSNVSNNPNSNTSNEDDEPSFTEDGNGDNSGGAQVKKGSPWQRMKWTSNVVKLLIQVVACVGDDGSLEGPEEGLKRKSGCIQKKGKWKTVSRVMMSKGCHVSPQQCEDKFNDLNKRYKKLNDILGRGTSCAVVENPALMDSMPQLSAKAKDTVKKILNSKHLFYREMCAYHNGQKIPDCNDIEFPVHSSPVAAAQCAKDQHGSQGDEAEENDENDSDDEEYNHDDERMRRVEEHGTQTSGHDNLLAEINEFFQDPTKSKWEQKMWIKKRMLQLEEEKIGIQAEAFELEKRQFKWKRFCSKKDRELEIERLENEKLMLENEHMALQLKHKEHEIDSTKPSISFNSAPLSFDRPRGRDQIDAARYH
ncbi:hypothetical protein K7X08_014097 [Anisodus acutangulus]|uniref:Myb/SANT-like DNA-binding domain-containing protein n=1 Tax=Anisodus acutangulus TaxID=402998 RepID=A0A9Q1R5V3_9SOLA|nr:hypothetical protein K7X08_014097 [Anisodus acutangulus]